MYYSHSCSYCAKVFYTFHNSKETASEKLYYGIKQHLIEYNEDHKEYQLDDGPSIDINEIFSVVIESEDAPAGGYEL